MLLNCREIGEDITKRVAFIRELVKETDARGIIYGNSGGKDCSLASILCKMACRDTKGVIMPCSSNQNYTADKEDALENADKFDILNEIVDLTLIREHLVEAMGGESRLSKQALNNIAPRLRMTTLYGIAATENRLVCGTGNKSEAYMGYFTKWGDGSYDFNPIADLTVTQIYQYLEYLGAPSNIIKKAPSAGLFDGQTDEREMGVTYANIDKYIETGEATPHDKEIIDGYHDRSAHKRTNPVTFGG